MKKLLFIALTLVCSSVFSQENKGIQFENAASWAEVKAKAKAENKYIFVDAYTTWCGPCKMMSAQIFPQEEVGQFFNANFINLKVQLDTSKRDTDDIKSWYQDAKTIKTNYNVNVYPTYLFLSPSGQLVHRVVGAMNANDFIGKGKDVLNPERQYYTQLAAYQAGKKSPELLYNITFGAKDAYDILKVPHFAKEYLATQKTLETPENARFIAEFTTTSKDPGFKALLNKPEVFDTYLGEGNTKATVKNIVIKEEIWPALFTTKTRPNWVTIQNNVNAKYPSIAKEAIGESKILYYGRQADWPAFSEAVSNHLKNFEKSLAHNQLNQYAWSIFENCEDVNCLRQALQWSKKSVEMMNDPAYMDTYANLLYKTGNKEEAIIWEEKAVAKALEENADASVYQDTLEKIKNGEKTW